MSILHALILGLVEGFTEFLPISSTAHLILVSELLGLDQSVFVKTFEIAIQSGAILAVLVIYWRKFLDRQVLAKIIVAFIPTAVIGLIFYKIAKTYLIGNVSVVLWALGIGGLILIIFERWYVQKKERMINDAMTNDQPVTDIRGLSYTKAALIGVAQAVAIIPGVSRSAATIIGGLLAGMHRAAVVEFSFLLAAPTIAAATVLDLYQNYSLFTADETWSLIVGFVAAFVTALVGIKFLLSFVSGKTFVGFGVYRIVVAMVFAFILWS